MEKKVKVGVFGGGRGNIMVNALINHPEAELVAVCEKYEPMLKHIKEKAEKLNLQVACYNNFDDFIRHPGMNAVILANYANEHAPYAIRCLNAGMHVMSEVLPCQTMAEAVELIEAVERTGLVYAYAENYCYMEHTFEMWQRYRRGEIGKAIYGEGEYVHDCSAAWPDLTRGDRNHWRNRMVPTYYCTHSVGPLIAMTGLRPVSVVGFETTPLKHMMKLGCVGGAGIEMVTMENGAVFKSLHGNLKREPSSINYELYCEKGMMESGRLPESQVLNIWQEGDRNCVGEWEKFLPNSEIAAEWKKLSGITSHNGSDFYPTHFFIEKILGRPEGEWSIDVYQAVEMGICGLLAYRSILAGNRSVAIPNLRDPKERDAWRNDRACTNPEIAGDQLLPVTSFEDYQKEPIADEVYDHVRQLWLDKKKG